MFAIEGRVGDLHVTFRALGEWGVAFLSDAQRGEGVSRVKVGAEAHPGFERAGAGGHRTGDWRGKAGWEVHLVKAVVVLQSGVWAVSIPWQ